MLQHFEQLLLLDHPGDIMTNRVAHDLTLDCRQRCDPIFDEALANRRERVAVVKCEWRHVETAAAEAEYVVQRQRLRRGLLPEIARQLIVLAVGLKRRA